jgi:hypothetical protein
MSRDKFFVFITEKDFLKEKGQKESSLRSGLPWRQKETE